MLVIALAFMTAALFSDARVQGVKVALAPSASTVSPGSGFDVTLQVQQAGSSFNAFDAVISYDPAALTFLQLSPLSQQEGALLTDACPNTFHDFRCGVGRDTVTDVLLCGGVSVAGPGQIYRLHFRASNTPQVTSVRFATGPKFYDGGIQVGPVGATNAAIGIGMPADVPMLPVRDGALRVHAAPNPMRGVAAIVVESGHDQLIDVTIRDVSGRLVRRLERGPFIAGTRSLRWDGRDTAGSPVHPGIYWVCAANGPRTASSIIAVIR